MPQTSPMTWAIISNVPIILKMLILVNSPYIKKSGDSETIKSKKNFTWM